jgi:hypothetical protein
VRFGGVDAGVECLRAAEQISTASADARSAVSMIASAAVVRIARQSWLSAVHDRERFFGSKSKGATLPREGRRGGHDAAAVVGLPLTRGRGRQG